MASTDSAPRSASVVIVGAGAIGCSIAYHLAQRGQTDVVVVERATIGAGSTSKAAGGIRAQFATELEIQFSLEGIERFKSFTDEFGVDIGYTQEGYLFVVSDPAILARYERNVALQNRFGVPSQVITPAEVRDIVPGISLDNVIAGVWCPTDGHATPNDVCMAFAAGARAKGVRFLEETTVTGMFQVVGGRTGVETTAGTIETPCVVIAAGANAAPVARMLDVEVPVVPKRRHIFVTDTFDGVRHPLPLVIDTASGFYARSEQHTLLMSPGDVGEVTDYLEAPVDWSVLERTVEVGIRRFPSLEQATVRNAWAGLRPLTPDEHAIVDWLPGVDGVFCAVGFCGHGFQHSPATGNHVAEWLLEGRPSLDLSPLGFARFAGRDTTVHGSIVSGVD
ncbi:MAG: FAD-binding oxidoreductase [Chloroflexi bacterium]|nr:FAD-binding oxidoreductase [Chloroflexota bacterium]